MSNVNNIISKFSDNLKLIISSVINPYIESKLIIAKIIVVLLIILIILIIITINKINKLEKNIKSSKEKDNLLYN